MSTLNTEPRLALWCHANPDQAAARIEALETELEELTAQLAKSCDDTRFEDSDAGCPRALEATTRIEALEAALREPLFAHSQTPMRWISLHDAPVQSRSQEGTRERTLFTLGAGSF
jgi:hypothetical protein